MSLSTLSQLSKRTDSDLIRIALGARQDLGPEAANLAAALYHERTGQHEAGQPCQRCDQARALAYSAEILAEA